MFPVLCDLDGVVWLAHQAIPGSVDAIARLRAAGHRVCVAQMLGAIGAGRNRCQQAAGDRARIVILGRVRRGHCRGFAGNGHAGALPQPLVAFVDPRNRPQVVTVDEGRPLLPSAVHYPPGGAVEVGAG